MDTSKIERQISDVFVSLGSIVEKVNDRVNYVLNGVFCVPAYVRAFNGFVVEYALSRNDANKNRYEDGEVIPVDDNLLARLKTDIQENTQ